MRRNSIICPTDLSMYDDERIYQMIKFKKYKIGIIDHNDNEVIVMFKLLFKPLIHMEESLSSYVYRIAASNGCSVTQDFLSLFSSNMRNCDNNIFSLKSIQAIAASSDQPHQFLENMSLHYFKQRNMEKGMLLKNGIKYCPDCLKEGKYHRYHWCFHPVTVCLKHHCYLLDECPSCKRKISIRSFMETQSCLNCSQSFLKVKSEEVIEDQILFQSQVYIQQLLASEQSKDGPAPGISFTDAMQIASYSFYLLEGLKSFVHRNLPIHIFTNKTGTSFRNQANSLVYANVYWMYQNFPVNFQSVLSCFKDKPSATMYEQKNMFEKLFVQNDCLKIQSAYNDFWIQEADAGNIRNDFSVFKQHKALLKKRGYASKEEVKKSTNLTYQAVERILQMVDYKTIDKGRITRKRINVNDFRKKVKEKAQQISRDEAAKQLGLQRNTVSKFVKEGIMHADFSFDKSGLIKRKQIEEIIGLCQKAWIKNTEGKLSLHAAITKYSVTGFSIKHIIRFVKEGKLIPYAKVKKPNLSNLHFDVQDIQVCVEIIKNESRQTRGYYLSDVIEILGVGEKTMHLFMKAQILEPSNVLVLKNGRKQYLFDKKMIDDFKKRFIPIEQAAQQFQLSTYKLRKWVREGTLNNAAKGISQTCLLDVQQIQKMHM